jgi:hypothetical protein
MEQAKGTGLEDIKGQFLQTIHTNIRQLTSFMRTELNLPSSYDEEILGRQVAKTIAFMSFNIDPLQVDVNVDDVVNQFLRSSNTLKNILKYKNFRFYKIISENNDAISACFGIYLITRVETVRGFDFSDWLNNAVAGAVTVFTGVPVEGKDVKKNSDNLGDIYAWINKQFGGSGSSSNKNIFGGIYFQWKYYKGQPYFGYAQPEKEQCSIGYFNNTWKPLIESESGMSFDICTEYFLKYYPYIKSGYFTTQQQFYAQARKDIADISQGKTVKTPASVGGILKKRKNILSRIFGL